MALHPGIWDHSTALPMYLVDTLSAPLALTVLLYHPSDFLQTAAGLFQLPTRQDLERTAGQSRLHNIITVLLAPSEDIFCSSDLSCSTVVDLAVGLYYLGQYKNELIN